MVLDADLAEATKTIKFKKACPERFFDCGIAEGNMISVAAGLAAAGKMAFQKMWESCVVGAPNRPIRAAVHDERVSERSAVAVWMMCFILVLLSVELRGWGVCKKCDIFAPKASCCAEAIKF